MGPHVRFVKIRILSLNCDAPTFRQQLGRSGQDAVNPVESEARFIAEDDRVA